MSVLSVSSASQSEGSLSSSFSVDSDNGALYLPQALPIAPLIKTGVFELSETEAYQTFPTLNPSIASQLCEDFGLSEGSIVVPEGQERAYNKLEGHIVPYNNNLTGGILLPYIHPLFFDLAFFWNFSLSQLVPNSFRTVVAFIITCHLHRIPVSLELFRFFYKLGVSSAHKGAVGYLQFNPRNRPLVGPFQSSVKVWKPLFLFVRLPDHTLLPGAYPGWNLSRVFFNGLPTLTEDQVKHADFLTGIISAGGSRAGCSTPTWPENILRAAGLRRPVERDLPSLRKSLKIPFSGRQ